jgi:opacity protein-like surface antigen
MILNMSKFKKQNFGLLSLIMILSAAPSLVRADDNQEQNDSHHRSWSISVAPRYLHNSNNDADHAFIANGFSAPKHDLFGIDFRALRRFEDGFLVGFELGGFGTEQDNGSSQATYNAGYLGLFLGDEFAHCGDTTFYVGTGLGYAGAEVDVYSTILNGKVTEGSFYFNPTLGADHKISDRFKVGLSVAYFDTISQSNKVTGQDLAIRDISPRGFTAQLNLVFGHF